MAEIVHFRPRAELDAVQNLRDFINLCRDQSTAFGDALRFDDDIWEVGHDLGIKGKFHEQRLVFSTWRTAASSQPEFMSEPFLSFAKGYMRYQHGARKTKSVSGRLAALRALEASLLEGGTGSHPASCRPEVLNRAAQLLRDHFSPAGAYRIGSQLKMMADFLVKHGLTTIGFAWRNPIARPQEGVRVGKAFDERRHERMPSPAALHALAKIFVLAEKPNDVLVSSVTAIMCAAPDRINEVLGLRVDCETTQLIPSTGEVAYGLRWWTSKGADPMIKWVVNSMASVVQEAIQRIVDVTAEARRIAKWYEANPTKIFLPAHLEHLRQCERLTLAQIGELLFVEPTATSSAGNWCRTASVPVEIHCRRSYVAFKDVERALLALLPKRFPMADEERGLKFSDALFIVRRNELHDTRGTYNGMFEIVEQGDISQRLGSRSDTGVQSIFDRFSLTEDDGRKIRLTTHQLRHYLNTLAQSGGLSQLDIAKWSGRKDVRQNNAYNHTSDRDVLALVRETVGGDLAQFGTTTKSHWVALIPRDKLNRLKIQTAHTTEFGYCLHDFTMLPCQQHMDCINCEEQVCIKGQEARMEKNIRALRQETEQLLQLATSAAKEGDAGADRWVEHQRLTLSRLDQLCAIFDDDRVPTGSAIRLIGLSAPSAIEVATERRLAAPEPMATSFTKARPKTDHEGKGSA